MRDFANLHAASRFPDVNGQAGVAILAGAGLAWLGPFGTVDQNIFVRLGFWTAMSVAWFALSTVVAMILARSARLRRARRWQQQLLTISVASLPGVFIAGFALVRMQNWRPDTLQVLDLYTQTMLVGAILEILCFALLERAGGERPTLRDPSFPQAEMGQSGTETPAREEPQQSPGGSDRSLVQPEPALLKRLPRDVQGAILCLQMEDHYVRIHTVAGSALILMRFSDAIHELGKLPGFKVHRSWWVARAAIQNVGRRGRTAQLELINGLTVPVSQPYLSSLAGLENKADLDEKIRVAPVDRRSNVAAS